MPVPRIIACLTDEVEAGLDGFLARGPVGGADLVAVLVDELPAVE